MSIIRVGLAETKNFSDGYDRIFGKKDSQGEKKETAADEAKKDEKKEPEKK